MNKKLTTIIIVGVMIFASLAVGLVFGLFFQSSDSSEFLDCTIAGITLHGTLATYATGATDADGYTEDTASSEDIVYSIQQAEADPSIMGILFEVDSVGGYPVAAEEVEQALKKTAKPTVALIREFGNSAAYYAASGADWIMASTLSDVGSIGVTSSYIDYSKNNVDQGITFNQLSTGLYKDMFNEDKPLTDEERAIAERDLKITFNKFIDVVATNRSLDRDKVVVLADGSSMLGEQALKERLIDQIGGETEALDYLEEKTGVSAEVCWY